MTEFLSYTITGLSLAAILAVAASGLVLTYTTTGVFNFAHGAIGMLGAFAYWQLRFDWGWPTPIAIAVVLLVLGPLFGVLLEVVIFRGLQQTTETIKLVVTVSLLFSMIGIANWIWDPNRPVPTRRSSAARSLTIGDVPVTRHELITISSRSSSRSVCATCCTTPVPASRCAPPSTTDRSPRCTAPDPTGRRCSRGRSAARSPRRAASCSSARSSSPRHRCRCSS